MMSETSPYRPLAIIENKQVFCKNCVHYLEKLAYISSRSYIRDGEGGTIDKHICKLTLIYSDPNPITGKNEIIEGTYCKKKNKDCNCEDFVHNSALDDSWFIRFLKWARMIKK